MRQNDDHTSHWSDFGKIFVLLLPRKLHGRESVYLRLSVLLGQSSQYAAHVISHASLDSDDVLQSNSMPFRHPQDPVPELQVNLHDIFNNRALILYCK
jgi:hypothetical protein